MSYLPLTRLGATPNAWTFIDRISNFPLRNVPVASITAHNISSYAQTRRLLTRASPCSLPDWDIWESVFVVSVEWMVAMDIMATRNASSWDRVVSAAGHRSIITNTGFVIDRQCVSDRGRWNLLSYILHEMAPSRI
jgi:hypothetical protein